MICCGIFVYQISLSLSLSLSMCQGVVSYMSVFEQQNTKNAFVVPEES